METFFGGQILEEFRGNLAAVIERPKGGRFYSAFLYPALSKDFCHLTGVRSAVNVTERVYIGISNSIGNEIAQQANGREVGTICLERIDELIIYPHFLDNRKPKKIVLESTIDGKYKIVSQE
jgi:hypothetical protein